ncbi:hypothetical protein PoB_004485300 [Plakobranchus ocellatus]|uniref:Uncharacterized protein n=1 Tax=Plakobranchus ocellatus TaxID=259542 RepID=A0AAV4BGS0_9GAST|nr:hypothetical protein PoB_004485300 [Plakobranchus ocellatus]
MALRQAGGADGRARTRVRRVPADLRAYSQATVPPTPPSWQFGPRHIWLWKRTQTSNRKVPGALRANFL